MSYQQKPPGLQCRSGGLSLSVYIGSDLGFKQVAVQVLLVHNENPLLTQ